MEKKHITAPILTLLLILPMASASTITRTLPASASPGNLVSVTLDISITGGETYYIVDEMVPNGWTVADEGTGDSTDPGHVKWVVIQNARNTQYTYQARAPQTEGTYSFSGIYMFEGMKTEGTIGGQSSIAVAQASPFSSLGSWVVVPIIMIAAVILSFVLLKSRR